MEPDRTLYSTGLVTVGQFEAGIDHPQFRDSGPIRRPVFVFPRTSVVIRHPGREPFLADPCTVTLYNEGQRYTREVADPHGDRCDWFSVRPDVLVDVLARSDPAAPDRLDRPFTRTHAASDPEAYATQRTIIRYLNRVAEPDALAVEEAAIGLLNRIGEVLGRRPSGLASARRTQSGGALLAEAARACIVNRFQDPLGLDDIAGELGCSVFHLCRVFRREVGTTIHRYRQQIRLRKALELIAEPGSNLTAIALRHGFSSHSHFTEAFRKVFGITPSEFRRQPSARRLRELEQRLA